MSDVSKIRIGNTSYDIKDTKACKQFSTMPTYTDYSLGTIIQYIGTTSANYINGYFYERGASGWIQKDVQPSGGTFQQVQADWNQATSTEVDYIKNKPETTNAVTSGSSALVTSGAVYTAIDNLPEPMVFKGTLGTGGTITALPTAAAANEGFTYKVITAGTYASQAAKVGDVFVSNGTAWVLIPAGDEDSDSWRAIQVNGVNFLGNAISTGYINIAEPTSGSSGLRLSASGNTLTISSLLPSVITTETDGSNSAKIGYCSYYKITNKSYVLVNLRTSNTAQSALTLTVNDKSTCPIYIDGEVSSATNYTLSAGTYLVYYESGKYYFRTDGKITAGGDVVDVNGNTTNNKVSQTTIDYESNAAWNVLLSGINGMTEGIADVHKASPLYYNPSTTRLHVPKLTDLTEINGVSSPEFANSLPSAYCDTIGTTADKVAQCTAFKSKSGGEYLHILMRNANTVQSALTLQIGTVGAKPIYINGVASSATNYTLPAGSYIIRHDGTNYYFRTDNKLPANIEGDAGTVNGKTVGTNVPADALFVKSTTYSGTVNANSDLSLSNPIQTVDIVGATVDNVNTYVCCGKNSTGKNMLAFRNITNDAKLDSGTSVSGKVFYID